MKNEEIYNKIMNLKIETADGKKIDYLNKDAKDGIIKIKKQVRKFKMLLKLFLILAIVSLVIMFIFFLISNKVPILLQFIIIINLGLIIIFFCMFEFSNYNYTNLLKSYNNIDININNIYVHYTKQILHDRYLDTLLSYVALLISEKDANIMKNVYNCIKDPKTYYIVHKESINMNLTKNVGENDYLVSGIISLLENNHYLSVLNSTCTKEEFLKSISSLDKSIDFNKIILNEDSLNDQENKVKNWIYSVNKVLKESDKAVIIFKLDNISNNKAILFITSFDYLFEFIKIPGMDYIYGRDLFKDDVENKKKYEISLLIREYATCDNYIEVKSEKLKDVVNNEKYIKAINECKTWDDIYKLDHELNKILNRKSDTSE